jgi:hypothetical protein
LQGAAERIQDEAKVLEGDRSPERLVARFAEDNRRMTVSLRKPDITFGDLALDNRAVSESETSGTLRSQSD